jgi:hypothetical protein
MSKEVVVAFAENYSPYSDEYSTLTKAYNCSKVRDLNDTNELKNKMW